MKNRHRAALIFIGVILAFSLTGYILTRVRMGKLRPPTEAEALNNAPQTNRNNDSE